MLKIIYLTNKELICYLPFGEKAPFGFAMYHVFVDLSIYFPSVRDVVTPSTVGLYVGGPGRGCLTVHTPGGALPLLTEESLRTF